ncbi:alpha/beta hydrolase [Alcaligenes faecalis]|uniref:alpha/beta hydrolase n=1 Tax=Alcaligenes faecalis TaxID=511 RepID=UPI0005A8F0E9|nr:alpha/beta hydrolase [Alcaligenes faecalis]ATH98289.1 hypothetical protein CPY64_00345 [Alcaligenes faecalis]AYZ91078.1 alpha/beta hydrolase [Alcaligenes faecalis]MCX5596040.1 alpha/beta hydrolase [Alcaligenes faecalis]QQC33111.1 alpha/beta hydrolase [Alcaligenes faecalis]CAJ0890657.1 Alpha/beta hydrolase [Alcaligenes faecalis subsp. faecalis]
MSRLIPLELPPAGGHPHHVLLRLPDGKPAQGPLPLLCLLDGQWTLPLLEESGHPALQHCAILSLGYQGDRDQITRYRALDYTPPGPDGGLWEDPRIAKWQAGGAPAMVEQVRMALALAQRVEPALTRSRISLYGHSYAGLFVLYALSQHSLPIQHYLCASPSLWWRDPLIWTLLEQLGKPVQVDILAGASEAWYPLSAQAAGPEGRKNGVPTLPTMQKLQAHLQAQGMQANLHVLPGAGHGHVLAQATLRALELACGAA